MKKLITRSCEEIMTTVYKPIEFVIDELVAQGLYILAGAPKVGKSWLALDMCLSIAKGESVLGQKTLQGTALYLCLEDSYVRIQNRLYEITQLEELVLHDRVSSDFNLQLLHMKKSTIIVIVVIVLIAIWGITSYNGMVKMDEKIYTTADDCHKGNAFQTACGHGAPPAAHRR